MGKKMISIITAMYNAEQYIETTIMSVISQDYDNWEMIIVDDFSTDNSYKLACAFAKKDVRIKIYQLNKKSKNGPASVRNYGLDKAKGGIITFLDSDDLWEPNFLSAQLKFMEETDCPFVFSSYRRCTLSSESIFHVPQKATYKSILKSNPISCLTAMYNRDKLGLHYMPEKAYRREDFACFLSILKVTSIALGNPMVLATYRIHGNSNSSGKLKIARYHYNVYRKVEKLGFFVSLYYLLCWVVISLKKYRGVKK